MQLSNVTVFPCHQQKPTLLHKPFLSTAPLAGRKPLKRESSVLSCRCSLSTSEDGISKSDSLSLHLEGRRALLASLLTTAVGFYAFHGAEAVSTSKRALRASKIPESDFKTLPIGLKYYDLKVGGGAQAVKGSRVAVRSPNCRPAFWDQLNAASEVHYVAKWRGITFMTSRQGLGVGGGTPYGFDVGQSERGTVLKGLDLGVEGMRVGGQRLLIVPPELAYGSKGVQEIPPNATIELDVELLSIKQNPFGSPVKIIEG
ncbi:hypothetical protein Tsubulata_018458 [Turnera subulata]|uniref:peptidylprolyl isomerase n=1 Tax=Turnera subulata TaxID=218843 RepID=A0A9Q0GI25_9ROSI|nr:hypothetical protein Tsubulata_018458 [Turnera subulata]